MSLNCASCGMQLPNDTIKFCPSCGASTRIGCSVNSPETIQKIIPSYSNKELDDLLYPLTLVNYHGFKAFFIGERGSKKDDALKYTQHLLFENNKIKCDNHTWVSFCNLPEKFDPDTLYIVGDLQAAINNLFNLDDLSGESVSTQRRYQEILERLIQTSNSSYIILEGTNVEYKGFITLDPRIPFIFSKKIKFDDLSNEEILLNMEKYLNVEYKNQITPAFRNDMICYLNRNRRFYPFKNIELSKYLANECIISGQLAVPAERYKTNSLEDLFSEIIGMENVKSKLVELNNYLSARVLMESKGATLPPFSLNMMFLGNPGVGKTSIARIISRILFDLGYIKEDKLIECTSKDLVSSYSGLTGVKTNRVISRAMGGVLFIDEAYALSNSCGQAGAEAIAILIKAMEDFRGEMVVMFAGYTAEMDDFVKSNSGIESRISYNFYFPDYTTDELLEIFLLKLKNTKLTITDEAIEAIRNILKLATGRRNFGNGRFVDKTLQAVLTKHASLNLPDNEIMCIKKESIPKIEEIMRSIK